MVNFNTAPFDEFELGAFTFKIYIDPIDVKKSRLMIGTTSDNWGMMIAGGTYTFGYLLTAYKRQDLDQLLGYAMHCYTLATNIVQNEAYFRAHSAALEQLFADWETEAQKAAMEVTEEQEQAAQAFIQEMNSYAEADEEGKKRISGEWEEIANEIDKEGKWENIY